MTQAEVRGTVLAMRRYCFGALLALICSCCFTACANQHFRVVSGGPPHGVARYVELTKEKHVATLHFPPGLYSFYAADDKGYYYRASRPILQHTGGTSVARRGGVFVSKQNSEKLRGYVFYAGALTHVGDLSGAPHAFRD
jgi:hypothetical protein